ncbi:cation:proton antiporter [Micromonospora sp. WMMD1102]|uniref:cation:proton antiporter domain-containing protein n=1 Tax=Micromonospora sp. WMMD1102 TaxID=3016105 RepID=UPI00241533D8|nr:cation:proton antiporter [Micromonospora sp. WMMD1102]MDG4789233.1 cation:proton antiporter [Micromonospora sp. WMMD1102]
MTPHAVGQLLLALAVIIAAARGLGAVARRLGQPPVVGEIAAGVLLGPSLFGPGPAELLFPAEIRPALAGLANVGLALFMFIIGYELDQALVRGRVRAAVSVSLGSIVLPLGAGVGLALWLAPRHDVERVTPFALFIGAAMAVTAFPVLARILADRGMVRTGVGALALASAAVDDVVAWTLLAGVVVLGTAGGTPPWQLLLALPYLLVMFLWVRPLLRRLTAARDRAGRLTPNLLGIVLIGLLLSCFATEWLGLHAIFGAFVFGAVMPRAGGEALRYEIFERLEQVAVLLLVPVFFVIAGLEVDLSTVGGAGLLELALILLVAVAGKFGGAYAGARLQGVAPRPAGALASLMNTRGLTEIVILSIGLQLGILSGELFSLMVVMALVTTVMTGPLLALVYPARLVRRDLAEAERAALADDGAYRILVVTTPSPEAGKSGAEAMTVGATGAVAAGVSAVELTALATDLVGARRPAEVVLSRLLPYPVSAIEVGSGLAGELVGMTTALRELARLAEPIRSGGLAAPVFARYTADPVADLAIECDAVRPALVVAADEPPPDGPPTTWIRVAAPPPEGWRSVLVRLPRSGGEAVLRIGAQLAAARDAELRVAAGARPGRRIEAAVRALTASGMRVRLDTGPDTDTDPGPDTDADTGPGQVAGLGCGLGSGAGGDTDLGSDPGSGSGVDAGSGPGVRERAGTSSLVVAVQGPAHLVVRVPRAEAREEPQDWVRQLGPPTVDALGSSVEAVGCDTYPTSGHGVVGLGSSGGKSG